MYKRQWGGGPSGSFVLSSLSETIPLLSAAVKFSQQIKLCALDESSRKQRVQVKRVLPAAITAEPRRNGLTKFIKPFNTRSKKGAWGIPSYPNS